MKILVFEYITGGGMRQEPIPTSLAAEGGLMLKALLDELLLIPGVELWVLHDDRLPLPCPDARIHHTVLTEDSDFARIWREAIDACDAVWPIAPETGGILERLCLDVESAGKGLLGNPAKAVHIAASKLTTLCRLNEWGLPVVPTLRWPSLASYPFVIKPDDGVGCEGSRIVRDQTALPMLDRQARWIVQPLIEGEALSLSALFAQGQARLLSCNRQWVEHTGSGFRLKGCQVNALADEDGLWQQLVGQVAQAMPELWGYAGIDLIQTAEGPMILEVNPRLTTSYAGLRQATGENLAEMAMDLWRSGRLPSSPKPQGIPYDILLDTW